MRSRVYTEQYPNPFHAGSNLFEQAEPLAAHRRLEILKSRDVAARTGKAYDKTTIDGLGYLREHDRDIAFQALKLRKRGIAHCDDRIRR